MANKTDRPAMVPVLPEWCDYHTYTPRQKIIFIGVTRAILALITFSLCVAFLAVFYSPLGVQIVLGLIIFLNICQIFITSYFTCMARSGDPKMMKQWLQVDIVFTVFLIGSVITLLCLIPANSLHIILGTKLIIISVFLCCMDMMYFTQLTDQHFPHPM